MSDNNRDMMFDLADTAKNLRPKIWTDNLQDFHYKFEYNLPQDFEFGKFYGGCSGKLKVARIQCDPMIVLRTKSHITLDTTDAYFMMLTDGSRITLCQRGSEAVISQKQFTFVSTSDSYSYYQDDTTSFHNLLIPGDLLRQFVPHIDDFVAHTSRNDSLNAIFYDYASALCMNFETINIHARDFISRQIIDLVALIYDGADITSNERTIQMAHYRRIVNIIDQNFANPALDTQMISDRLRMSKRYVQKIFSRHLTSVSTTIRRRRIAEARRLFEDANNRLLVSEVASRVGFTDIAHFSRVFKAETGYAPSQFARDYRR